MLLTHGPCRPLGVNPGEEAEDARRVVSQLVSTLQRAEQVHNLANGMSLAAPRTGIGRAAAVIRLAEGETVTGQGRDLRRGVRPGRCVLQCGQPDDTALGERRCAQAEKGWRLALYLVRQPLWLLDGAAAVGSYAFQTLALHNGPVSVVQPVLVAELVFVMALRRVWIRQHVADFCSSGSDLLGAAVPRHFQCI